MAAGSPLGAGKPRKYGNKPVRLDNGITFDSQAEYRRWIELKLLVDAGVIKELERQPKYKLTCGGKPVMYETGRQATYTADFRYWDIEKNRRVVEDVKGKDTRDSKLRRAVLKAETGIEVKILKY